MRLCPNIEIRLAGRGHWVGVGHKWNLGQNSEFQGGTEKYFASEWRARAAHAISWRRAIELGANNDKRGWAAEDW